MNVAAVPGVSGVHAGCGACLAGVNTGATAEAEGPHAELAAGRSIVNVDIGDEMTGVHDRFADGLSRMNTGVDAGSWGIHIGLGCLALMKMSAVTGTSGTHGPCGGRGISRNLPIAVAVDVPAVEPCPQWIVLPTAVAVDVPAAAPTGRELSSSTPTSA